MALTPEQIQAAAKAQAELNKLIKEYNSLTGQSISNPIDPKDFKDATSYAKALNNEIVKFTKINVDSQKELGSAIDSLTDSLKEYEKATGRAIENRINPKNYKTAAEYAKALKEEQSRINSLLLNAESGLNSISSRFSDIGKEIKAGFGKSTNSAMKSVNKIYSLTEQLFDVQQDLTQASAKDVKQQKEKVIAEFDRLNRQLKGLGVQEKENDLAKKRIEGELNAGKLTEAQATARLAKLNDEGNKITELKNLAEERSAEFENQNGLIKDINAAYNDTIDRINNINNATGLTGKILGGIGGTLEKLGFKGFGEKVTEINRKLKEQAVIMTDNGKHVATFGQQFALLKSGVSSLGSELAASLRDPLVVIGLLAAAIKKLIHMGMHLSQEITDVGRSFNVSREAAEELFNSIKKSAVTSGSLLANTKDMIAAQANINQQLGTTNLLSDKELETQVALTKVAGLSNEQAAELYKYSLLTGESSEDLYDAIAAQGEGLFNNRQILQEALEVEGQLAAQYKNDPKLIAQAVRQVKKLGINLQQAQGIAKSMLDFESSIESELEAQLLTGRRINLGRVRELALRGETAKAAEEALKQAGSLEEFQNMNVIAQESLASAMGMSTDELAKSLKEQERINALMAQDPRLSREQATLAAQRENMSASEKLNASMSKLSDAFAKVVGGPVTFAVDAFSKIVGGLASMPGLVKIIAGGGIVLGGLALFSKGIPAIFQYFKRAATAPAGSATDPTTSDLTEKTIQSISSASAGDVSSGIGGGGGGGTRGRGTERASQTGTTKSGRPDMRTKAGRKMAAQQKMKGGGMLSKMGGAGGALMSGLGMAAQAAPLAASMFGRNLEQQGADAGNRTKETVGSSLAQAGDVGVAKQSVGLLGGLGGKVGGLLSKLNPMEAVKKTVGKFAPKILSSAPKMAKRIPVLGAAIEGIFAAKDIAGMISSGMPQDDIYQNIGRRAFQAIGGILGGAGASLAIQAANIVPGLGVILTPLAGLAGDFIGRSLGGLFADASPSIAGSVGKGLSSIFPGGEQVVKGDKVANSAASIGKEAPEIKTPTPEVKLATGGIVSQPTTALVGEAGPEAVMPLDALYRKFDELIQAVNKGGSVYIDGNKAGEALVMGTYKSA